MSFGQSNHINRNQTNFQPDVSIYHTDSNFQKEPLFPDVDFNDTIDTSNKINDMVKVFSHQEVADRLSLNDLKANLPDKLEEINWLFDIVCEVLSAPNPVDSSFRIAKLNIPFINVKDAFLNLEKKHIEYVIHSLNNNGNKFKITKNTKSYLMTSLFHAPRTISYYFDRNFKKAPKQKDAWDIKLEQIAERRYRQCEAKQNANPEPEPDPDTIVVDLPFDGFADIDDLPFNIDF